MAVFSLRDTSCFANLFSTLIGCTQHAFAQYVRSAADSETHARTRLRERERGAQHSNPWRHFTLKTSLLLMQHLLDKRCAAHPPQTCCSWHGPRKPPPECIFTAPPSPIPQHTRAEDTAQSRNQLYKPRGSIHSAKKVTVTPLPDTLSFGLTSYHSLDSVLVTWNVYWYLARFLHINYTFTYTLKKLE